MALSADTKPYFTTIAHFISSMDKEIAKLFRDILLICDEQGLIGKEMFPLMGASFPPMPLKNGVVQKQTLKRRQPKWKRPYPMKIEFLYRLVRAIKEVLI